jgi:DNA-binding NarL/FixJ family response regulator
MTVPNPKPPTSAMSGGRLQPWADLETFPLRLVPSLPGDPLPAGRARGSLGAFVDSEGDGEPAHGLRVVVIDDHQTFGDLLSGALSREPDFDCVGVASTVAQGVALCAEVLPDLVVLDYQLPDGNGLQAAERILERDRAVRIIMLTGIPTAPAIRRAAAIGVGGFLPKDGALSALLEVMRTVRPGGFQVAPALISALDLDGRGAAGPGPRLTARELDVLHLMSQGYDVSTNAKTLGITTHTCRGYVKSILAKLDAHSQLEAVAVASRLGLLEAV